MRIGYVLDDTLDKPDGVQQSVLAIGSEMSKRGHEVHYIVTSTIRKDIENVHSVGKYISLPFNGNSVRTPLPASKKSLQNVLDLEFDVLHVQMPYSPLMSGKLIKQTRPEVKVFGTFHILPYSKLSEWGTNLLGLALNRTLKRFSGFTAVSKPALNFMQKTFSVNGSVLPNPVNFKYFNSFKKQQNDKKQIVYVGRFDERKGVRQLVEAYEKLPMQLKEKTDLIMCGKGPLHEEVKKLAIDSNLKIKLPGFVSEEEKAQYLANADIAVFPSVSGESFGIVLTEAMSAGAGVTIGGNNPGYSSVLGEWPETLFDPNKISDFTDLIINIIQGDKKYTEIGKKQRKIVKKYDVVEVCSKLEKMYSS